MEKQIKIGWAQTSITPDRPVLIEGQMYMRYNRYVHDPITATVLVLENGDQQAILLSLDMTEPPCHVMGKLTELLKAHPEIDPACISFSVTHSHNSTSFYNDFMRCENEQVYDPAILPQIDLPEDLFSGDECLSWFAEKLCGIIVRAWEARKPGGISAAHDYAAVAFNRRPQFLMENGLESIMYGDCSREDFIGLEAGTDTAVELLYTWDEAGSLTGVICNVPCPSQVYELHYFLSADYWAPTRDLIREKLGANIYVLSLCGAAGDLAPVDLIHISKTNKVALKAWGGQTKEFFRDFDMTLLCQSIGERISEAVVRGYKTARNYIDYTPVFRHTSMTMSLPIRQVSEADYQEAAAQVAQLHQEFTAENPMTMEVLVRRAFEPQGVILRYRQQKANPNFDFTCHILRIGKCAMATNPFELYHEFAQRIKARAQAEQVFIVQLANGVGGYLPTRAAVQGGSYSSKPASTVCGPEGGDLLVQKTLETIGELWK